MTATAAVIETATVEIRTLTVNGRRMSAGYLRQLIEAPVISAAGELLGEPWGTVNLHPDKCEDGDPHLHVVWQEGDQLRRSRVNAPGNALFETPVAAHYAMSRILDGARGYEYKRNFRIYRSQNRLDAAARAHIRHDGFLFAATIPVAFHKLWESDSGDLSWARRTADDAYGAPMPPPGKLIDQMTAAADAYRTVWSALENLPQLFVGG